VSILDFSYLSKIPINRFNIEFLISFSKSVDDWKKKRRQKQKPSTSRLLESGEEETESVNKSTDRKRINKFEHSQYFLMPLSADGTAIDVASSSDHALQQEKIEIETTVTTKNVTKQHQTLPVESSKLAATNSTNTIEISGVTHQDNSTKKSETEQNVNNDTGCDKSVSEDNELEESTMQSVYYVEKFIEITRPINYAQRGFGFLLNTGVSSKGNVNSVNNIILKTGDTETTVVNDSYAQVVVVEPG
jgi:hypothetical protein